MCPISDYDIYGGKEPGDIPFYAIHEAAHCLQLPLATVRSWTVGRTYKTLSGPTRFQPVISIADPEGRLLSFRNLVELHVLSSILHTHKVKLPAVRQAIKFMRERYQSDHPLLNSNMITDGKYLFIEEYGNLINISQNGQNEMKSIIDIYLKRIVWDESGIPVRLFPFTQNQREKEPKYVYDSPRYISIDPKIRFGKPCIAGTNVPTSIVAERYKAGETIAFLADDYGREQQEIEEAIRYESRIAS